jgi:signal transduction histidine kinase/ActR/RegA family two-component response regulator
MASAAAYALFAAGLTLYGWIIGDLSLATWNTQGITMKPNAAICALACGAGLLLLMLGLQRPWLIRVLAALSCLIGAMTFFEHLAGVSLGIDTLLFDEAPGALATAAPGRMGPPASLSFSLLGVCLWLLTGSDRARRLASGLAIAPVFIAAFGMVGYVYGASALYAAARVTGIAAHTAVLLAGLGVGVAAAVPEHGVVAALVRDDPGGLMLRRLAPMAVLIPIAAGWMRLRGEHAGWYDAAFGSASRTLLEIGLFGALIWWTAGGVGRHARAAKDAEQALREAGRRKDEFLATLAHELRNPLAPLRTASELLGRMFSDAAAVARAQRIIDHQLTHMIHIVDDLLDVSRISRGKIELRRQRLQLAEVVEQALETVQPLIEERRHDVAVTSSPEPLVVEGDATRLTQVITNLLNNAIKYTDPGGRIAIRLERDGSDALVRIRDNGMGIAPDALPRIFDMFTRSARSLEGAQPGLGIGLALVKQIVDLHGGRVDVSSPPADVAAQSLPRNRAGSEFVVRLPTTTASAAEPAPAAPPASATRASRPLRILVADDNADAGDTLAELLEDMGHQTRTARDGEEAWAAAESMLPDLAFLDIGMPRLSGHEVCRRIRAQPWGRGLLLVALSGWGRQEDLSRSSEAGFDLHLVKPARLAQIEDIVGRAVASERP